VRVSKAADNGVPFDFSAYGIALPSSKELRERSEKRRRMLAALDEDLRASRIHADSMLKRAYGPGWAPAVRTD
jgi:hypothetical protein